MAALAPFRGLTYNVKDPGDAAALLTPPYDVITQEAQEAYYRRSPYNVIRLILGKGKKGDSDWDNKYTRAADFFSRWQSEDVIVRAGSPCMYLTSMTYDLGGALPRRTRWGLIALVRLEEDSGVILPHERTFSAHKDDRLKLMTACRAQFSPIFGLYRDPQETLLTEIRKGMDMPPLFSFEFEGGMHHQMWVLKDPSLFRQASEIMSAKSIFIADGHHRYETALNFRNLMRARYGSRPKNRSYDFVMFYLSSMDAEGLTILPSHRLVKRAPGFELEAFLKAVGRWFEITAFPLGGSSRQEAYQNLSRMLGEKGRENSAIGFHLRGGDHCYLLSLKPGMREGMGEDLHPALKRLDVLVLSRFLLQKGLGFERRDLDNEEIFHYNSSLQESLAAVDSGAYQMAFLLNPTRIEQVEEVAGNGLIMPRKSTYFYPKVLTGLVFNKIEPHEIIRRPAARTAS